MRLSNIGLTYLLFFTVGMNTSFSTGGDKDSKLSHAQCVEVCSHFQYEVFGLTVAFQLDSLNANNINEYIFDWSLGDGTEINEAHFEHTYRALGHYFTCLSITDATTKEEVTRTCKYVDIGADDLCDVDYNPVCGCDNKTYMNPCFAETYHGVHFWSFGKCSPYINPSLIPEYTYSISDRSIDFINASMGSYDTFEWDFGDGFYSKQRNPSHSYQNDGVFEICLTISNSYSKEKADMCEYINIKSDCEEDTSP